MVVSSPLVWVVGAGGLLGSAVLRELGGDGFSNTAPLSWADSAALRQDFSRVLRSFAERLAEQPGRSWAIAWCAGLGVIRTNGAQLEAETATFGLFLDVLAGESGLSSRPGHVLLVSSAGGLFGGSSDCPITENTPTEPISAYGREKLAQERLLSSWAQGWPTISTLVARLSNVYGPGQRLEKQQGLISQVARCIIYDAPVHLYVSVDTIRDYLFADDAARRVCAGLRRLVREAPAAGWHVTKIYAAESEISSAGLLGVFREIAERPPRVVFDVNPVAALQPARLQFRSNIWLPEIPSQVELVEGVRRVYRHQLELFAEGQLPPPPAPESTR